MNTFRPVFRPVLVASIVLGLAFCYLQVAEADVCACTFTNTNYFCIANNCNIAPCSGACSRACVQQSGPIPYDRTGCVALCTQLQSSGTTQEQTDLVGWSTANYNGGYDGATGICNPAAGCSSLPTAPAQPSYDYTNSGAGTPCSSISTGAIDGATCDVACASGYVAVSGTAKLTCSGANNLWTGNLVCAKSCAAAPSSSSFPGVKLNPNADSNDCSSAAGKASCNAACDTANGYTQSSAPGTEKLTCGSDGVTWTTALTCNPPPYADCSAPPVTDGHHVDMTVGTCKDITSSNKLAHGASCTYGCPTGYQPVRPVTCFDGHFTSVPYCFGYPLSGNVWIFGTKV